MGRQVAVLIDWPLAPHPVALAIAVAIDFAAGDPEYPLHPVRLIGRSLQAIEAGLRRVGADGYGGGIVLFVLLALIWVAGVSGVVMALSMSGSWLGWAAHVFVLYSFLALGDLLRHGRDIERAVAAGALDEARRNVSKLVGRDTAPMDGAACRRAAVESLSENLTDGFTSAVFWYAIGGLPLLTLFKVVSTMDSMVGYKTPRYLQFGWCGARLDDAMNFVPARLTWLLVAAVAAVFPEYSGRKALRVGIDQHALLPGPNAGWSEAAVAGAVSRRLVGPIWLNGRLVTDRWLGDPGDPPLETSKDYRRASRLIAISGVSAAGAIALWLGL
jgi:adenosylcobinamide-phosphate synthase